MIPGSKPKIEASHKVRIGVKKTSNSGKEYPASVDYFVSEAFDDQPRSMLIRFVHEDVEDAFSSGLEWWAAKEGRNYLACYTKDGGSAPVALRLEKMLDPGQEAIGPPRGSGRLPILCPARDCPHLKAKRCKPMGRLVFSRVGSPLILQLDTKSWNSVERLTGALQHARLSGPLNAPDRFFRLSVEFVQKGSDRFPVMFIREEFADSPQTAEAIATGESIIAAEQEPGGQRAKLIAALRARGLDPSDPKVSARVREVGVDEALRKLTNG